MIWEKIGKLLKNGVVTFGGKILESGLVEVERT